MVDSRRVTVARARPLAWSSLAKLSMPGAADREQGQGAGSAPGGDLAQVEGVGLSCQATVPDQESG